MSKRICAKLKDECCRIFNEDSENFDEIYSLFEKPNLSNIREFDSNVKLDDDERFFIELNDEQKNNMLGQYFRLINNSASTNQVVAEDYANIQAIFLIQGEIMTQSYEILFSKITPKLRIENRKIIFRDINSPQIHTIEN